VILYRKNEDGLNLLGNKRKLEIKEKCGQKKETFEKGLLAAYEANQSHR
jgi:hypothetical protein